MAGLAFEAPERISALEVEAPELIAWIESKAPREIGNWRELGADEYARSFTASRTIGSDIVRDLHDEFLRILKEPGATGDDFVDRMLPILRRKGWLQDKSIDSQAARLLLIYDTNLRTAQAVGQWTRIQRVAPALPYLLGMTAHDSRVRHPPKSEEDHRAFEGILLPVEHPFWQAYFPPLGFRCRCNVIQLSRGQVARRGLSVTSESALQERVSRLGKPWGFNPGVRPMKPVEDMAERANERRLDGAPPIDAMRERQLATATWQSLAGKALLAGAVDALIAQLFGN